MIRFGTVIAIKYEINNIFILSSTIVIILGNTTNVQIVFLNIWKKVEVYSTTKVISK